MNEAFAALEGLYFERRQASKAQGGHSPGQAASGATLCWSSARRLQGLGCTHCLSLESGPYARSSPCLSCLAFRACVAERLMLCR